VFSLGVLFRADLLRRATDAIGGAIAKAMGETTT
jgi:hypothetical protein